MTVTYEAIASTTLVSGQSTVTIGSGGTIPQTYTDLIVVINASPVGAAGTDILVTFNNDTGSNYSRTFMLGDGSSASSGRTSSTTAYVPSGIYANGNYIMNINNYSNSTTYKTPITRTGVASVYTVATVGLWRNTAAINRIDFYTLNQFAAGSTFSLYGIKAE
jgi:hypothetical protein